MSVDLVIHVNHIHPVEGGTDFINNEATQGGRRDKRSRGVNDATPGVKWGGLFFWALSRGTPCPMA